MSAAVVEYGQARDQAAHAQTHGCAVPGRLLTPHMEGAVVISLRRGAVGPELVVSAYDLAELIEAQAPAVHEAAQDIETLATDSPEVEETIDRQNCRRNLEDKLVVSYLDVTATDLMNLAIQILEAFGTTGTQYERRPEGM